MSTAVFLLPINLAQDLRKSNLDEDVREIELGQDLTLHSANLQLAVAVS